VPEVRFLVERYRLEYHRERLHSARGYRTPAEFAAYGVEKNVASRAFGTSYSTFTTPRPG
jgi:hypothetical protein